MTFFLSKFLWLLINPFNIFIYILLLVIFLLILKKNKTALVLLIFNVLFILMISVFPLGNFLLFQLEKKFHNVDPVTVKIDGILILGGASNPYLSSIHKQLIFNNSSERLIESIKLIKKYKDAKVVFSGGLGDINYPNLDHAKVAKDLFDSMEINTTEIIFENKSKNTYENIIFSKKIANIKKNEKWLLVTSAFHMNRAMLIANKHGLNLIPYPVDFRLSKNFNFKPTLRLIGNLKSLDMSLREWTGLFAYYLMGRSSGVY